MDDLLITDPAQAGPAWLTEVLRGTGDLVTGRVVDVHLAPTTSTHAATSRLLLRYSLDATGALPRSLFLKICKAESAAYFGRSEIDLYAKLCAPIMDSPVPRCYRYGYDVSGRYFLLLEDLSDTHHSNFGIEPTAESAHKTARALAALHAFWWDRRDLRTDERFPTAAVISRQPDTARAGLQPMIDYLGTRLTAADRAILHEVFTYHPARMVERAATGQDLTYVHGDPNPGNILSPHDPAGRAYLVDRQLFDYSPGIWLGVSDLAYMMVHWWAPARRRALEQGVLTAYHEALQQRGVAGYSRAQLWRDYRLTAVQGFYIATDWCRDADERTTMEWVWWPQLQKCLAAYHDLGCSEVVKQPMARSSASPIE